MYKLNGIIEWYLYIYTSLVQLRSTCQGKTRTSRNIGVWKRRVNLLEVLILLEKKCPSLNWCDFTFWYVGLPLYMSVAYIYIISQNKWVEFSNIKTCICTHIKALFCPCVIWTVARWTHNHISLHLYIYRGYFMSAWRASCSA